MKQHFGREDRVLRGRRWAYRGCGNLLYRKFAGQCLMDANQAERAGSCGHPEQAALLDPAKSIENITSCRCGVHSVMFRGCIVLRDGLLFCVLDGLRCLEPGGEARVD